MGDPNRFATTRWSLVVAAGHRDAPEGAAALSALCETYWMPVYAFIRRTGKSREDSRDLAQAFFARMIEKNDFSTADPSRGRFRSFLLASVRNFLINQHDAAIALKRGGGAVHVSIEVDEKQHSYAREPVDRDTPDRVFDRRWALAVLEAALKRLGARYAGDRQVLFDKLRPALTAGDSVQYADLAGELGMTEGALRVALHRMRGAYREALRDVILDTVEREEDVDDELKYLVAALAQA